MLGEGPAVLCVPGGPGRAAAYLEDLGGLAASYTLLLLDQRGSGRSELPSDRASLAFPRLADDVDVVRQKFGLDTVRLLGHSAGCYVSMAYASRYPSVVEQLVLVTPPGHGFADTSADVQRIRRSRSNEPWYAEVAALEAELELLPPHRRERVDGGLRPYFYGKWDERARAHAASTDSQVSLRAAAAFMPADPSGVPDPDQLCRIEARTLVVVGSLDAMTGCHAGEVIVGRLPQAELAVIEGAGHYPWVDEPDAFRAVVADFLGAHR